MLMRSLGATVASLAMRDPPLEGCPSRSFECRARRRIEPAQAREHLFRARGVLRRCSPALRQAFAAAVQGLEHAEREPWFPILEAVPLQLPVEPFEKRRGDALLAGVARERREFETREKAAARGSVLAEHLQEPSQRMG